MKYLQLMALSLLCFIGSALALPLGTYVNSCRFCRINKGIMRCQCINPLNNWQITYLHNIADCQFVVNDRGHLRCRRRVRDDLPPGNYQYTCNRCHYYGFLLTCMCQDMDGFYHPTGLKRAGWCRNIRNLNSHLTCTWRKQVLLPPGSYRSSCYHCKYNGYRLTCDCLRFDNHLTIAKMDAANVCRWIRNFNGTLYCQ